MLLVIYMMEHIHPAHAPMDPGDLYEWNRKWKKKKKKKKLQQTNKSGSREKRKPYLVCLQSP